jgi:long-chain acyl-CoA synthetase
MAIVEQDVITPREAGTLPGLFRERVNRTPDQPAYRSYDILNGIWMDTTWREISQSTARWERALYREKLEPGDRVAIMARNSRLWVMFDQAALALGLVVVPIYTEDRGDNVQYILE